MAEHVQRPEIGAVGARLLSANGTIEQAGIVVGVDKIAQPAFHGFPAEHPGANRQLQVTRNCSAVSSACMLTKREVFQETGGFDETLEGSLADVDSARVHLVMPKRELFSRDKEKPSASVTINVLQPR